MHSVIEEECSGNGALACMLAMPKADAVIIPEPGPGLPALYSAEVGVVWAGSPSPAAPRMCGTSRPA